MVRIRKKPVGSPMSAESSDTKAETGRAHSKDTKIPLIRENPR
jgi:hypothetical protein